MTPTSPASISLKDSSNDGVRDSAAPDRGSSCAWMLGSTPPSRKTAPRASELSSSSFAQASMRCRASITDILWSLVALPESSSISALRTEHA